jgi:hypothetical protein
MRMSRRQDHSSLLDDKALQFNLLNLSALNDAEIKSMQNEGAAKGMLQRWLSIRSVVSTSSSNAIRQQEVVFNSNLQVFRSIGKGFCGQVYEKLGTNRVYKRELNPGPEMLWNDYKWHTCIYGAIFSGNFENEEKAIDNLPMIRVPQVYAFITQDSQDWWKQNGEKFSNIAPRAMTCLLETERIQTLPKVVRQAIITVYCPQKQDKVKILQDPENQNCLARIYLGVRRQTRSQSEKFSLQNFELDLQILDDFELEKEHYAREMARSLAIMHWKCQVSCEPVLVSRSLRDLCSNTFPKSQVDADDVEFVLGSAPTDLKLTSQEIMLLPPNTATETALNFKKRAVYMWLLDFNNCSEITMDESGVEKAEAAFWRNDPYYPRPVPPNHQDEYLWKVFESSYLEQSKLSANDTIKSQQLPQKFINLVNKTARHRFNQQRGFSSSGSGGPPRNAPFSTGGSPTAGSPSRNSPFSGSLPARSPSSAPPSSGSPRRGHRQKKSREYPGFFSGSGSGSGAGGAGQ